MHADIQGAIKYLKGRVNGVSVFEHKGKRVSNEKALEILHYAKAQGYVYTAELSDKQIEDILYKEATKSDGRG